MSDPAPLPPLPPALTLPAQTLQYATPVGAAADNAVWCDGTTLIVPHGTTLPPYCVKCNAPVEEPPVKRTYRWHNPLLYLIILFNLIIYAIVALIVRKKGRIQIHVCRHHVQRQWIAILLALVLTLGGLALLIGGGANDKPILAVTGIVAFILGIVAAFVSRMLYPTKIDEHVLWLKGAGPEFCAQFPPAPWTVR